MVKFLEWLYRQPLLLVFLYAAVAFGGGRWLIDSLSGPPENPLFDILGGLIFASIMTPIIARARRKDHRFAKAIAIQKALRTQTVPEGVELGEVLASLDRQRASLVRARWLYPAIFGGLLVLNIPLLFVIQPAPATIVLLGVLVALFVWVIALSFGRIRRIDALRATLLEGPARQA
jgi:hypothetical protein